MELLDDHGKNEVKTEEVQPAKECNYINGIVEVNVWHIVWESHWTVPCAVLLEDIPSPSVFGDNAVDTVVVLKKNLISVRYGLSRFTLGGFNFVTFSGTGYLSAKSFRFLSSIVLSMILFVKLARGPETGEPLASLNDKAAAMSSNIPAAVTGWLQLAWSATSGVGIEEDSSSLSSHGADQEWPAKSMTVTASRSISPVQKPETTSKIIIEHSDPALSVQEPAPTQGKYGRGLTVTAGDGARKITVYDGEEYEVIDSTDEELDSGVKDQSAPVPSSVPEAIDNGKLAQTEDSLSGYKVLPSQTTECLQDEIIQTEKIVAVIEIAETFTRHLLQYTAQGNEIPFEMISEKHPYCFERATNRTVTTFGKEAMSKYSKLTEREKHRFSYIENISKRTNIETVLSYSFTFHRLEIQRHLENIDEEETNKDYKRIIVLPKHTTKQFILKVKEAASQHGHRNYVVGISDALASFFKSNVMNEEYIISNRQLPKEVDSFALAYIDYTSGQVEMSLYSNASETICSQSRERIDLISQDNLKCFLQELFGREFWVKYKMAYPDNVKNKKEHYICFDTDKKKKTKIWCFKSLPKKSPIEISPKIIWTELATFYSSRRKAAKHQSLIFRSHSSYPRYINEEGCEVAATIHVNPPPEGWPDEVEFEYTLTSTKKGPLIEVTDLKSGVQHMAKLIESRINESIVYLRDPSRSVLKGAISLGLNTNGISLLKIANSSYSVNYIPDIKTMKTRDQLKLQYMHGTVMTNGVDHELIKMGQLLHHGQIFSWDVLENCVPDDFVGAKWFSLHSNSRHELAYICPEPASLDGWYEWVDWEVQLIVEDIGFTFKVINKNTGGETIETKDKYTMQKPNTT
ncbi:hypothetical protein MAR_035017 [Mya arenaria]|uniref:Uncharacterized protein n=1 Tax=Mya arenaria TaxID=6604 RepID=A0ABY7ERX1_MYAAR|nr:hypothetical protein MAR_035017 [Mya arenaria]